MAISSNKTHIRSISLPARSHPSTAKIDQELNKCKAMETSTSGSSISGILSGLDDLYKCLEDLLNMTSTREILSRNRHEICVDELLDGSVRLLDFCGFVRDLAIQMKEHVRSLQSALRRRKVDSEIEINITNFSNFRKNTNKNSKKFIAAFKQTDNRHATASLQLDLDHHLSAVIRVMREVNTMNISTFQSLSLFFTAPISKPKQSKWSLVSKLMHKGVIACEEKQENVNELESVDAALSSLGCGKQSGVAQKRLEAMETCIEELEKGLETVFRRLIKTRTSLLDIISL